MNFVRNFLPGPISAHSARRQAASGLWSPQYWGADSESGNLTFDGVNLADLVEQFGSPLIAVSRSRLRQDACRFIQAVTSSFPSVLATYSYKTNCIPGVLQELHQVGFGAEVISPYELWLAEKLGVEGNRIIVNGVNKDIEFIDHAVRLNVASINIDDMSELDMIRQCAKKHGTSARVSLRLKLDRASHFGLAIDSQETMQAVDELAKDPVSFDFRGLHFHLLAANDDPEKHIAYLRKALAFAKRIRDQYQLVTKDLSIGGGYTVPTVKVMSRTEYGLQRLLQMPCSPPNPDAGVAIEDYMRIVSQAFRTVCSQNQLDMPRIIFEPGRIVTSQSHVLLSKIHAIKKSAAGPDTAMTDAGKILTSYPCDYEYHQMFVANRMNHPCAKTYHLMGRLCTPTDWLAKYRYLPTLSRGDVVAVMDAGAYFTSYSSNFSFPRPELLMLDDGEVQCIRNRETFEHLTAMDEFSRNE